VSKPAILEGQVNFTITVNRLCSHYNWLYMLQNAKDVFYVDNTTIIQKVNKTGEVNTTYSLILMKATSNYNKLNISFGCDNKDSVDTVTLDLIGKQKHYNVCMCRK